MKMVKAITILAVLAVAMVLGVLFTAVTDEAIPIATNDADYEIVITINYVDGTSTTVKKFKALTAYHDDKLVESISISVDVKFKAKSDDPVQVLSTRSDPDHATELSVFVGGPAVTDSRLTTHPLSADTGADYSTVERGRWYHLFTDVGVTTSEVAQKQLTYDVNWHLLFVLEVWYNDDPDVKEAKLHQIEVKLPLEFMPGGGMTNEQPSDPANDPVDPEDAKLDPTNEYIAPGEPLIKKKQDKKEAIPNPPWKQSKPGQDSKNLDPRDPGFFTFGGG